jgi:hypothetical protein
MSPRRWRGWSSVLEDKNAKSAQKVHWMSSIAIGALKSKEDRTDLLSETIEVETARGFLDVKEGCKREVERRALVALSLSLSPSSNVLDTLSPAHGALSSERSRYPLSQTLSAGFLSLSERLISVR